MKVLEREIAALELACERDREKLNVLGTAAAVANAAVVSAGSRERRMFALAGLTLTAINVAVAVWGG